MERTSDVGLQVNGVANHQLNMEANENRAALYGNGELRGLLGAHFLSGVG